MRPGTLARLGLGYDVLAAANPRLVFATLSGYGATGPYKDMPSHGIAYDTWSGIVQPVVDDEGFTRIPPDMPNVGINVGPMLAALAVLAAVIKAPRHPARAARSRWPSPTPRPTWTGTGSSPSGPTCGRPTR